MKSNECQSMRSEKSCMRMSSFIEEKSKLIEDLGVKGQNNTWIQLASGGTLSH